MARAFRRSGVLLRPLDAIRRKVSVIRRKRVSISRTFFEILAMLPSSRRIRSWFGSALWKQGRFRTSSELRDLARRAGLTPGTVVGGIYYPRSVILARLLAPHDEPIGKLTTFGAAFLALQATKDEIPDRRA